MIPQQKSSLFSGSKRKFAERNLPTIGSVQQVVRDYWTMETISGANFATREHPGYWDNPPMYYSDSNFIKLELLDYRRYSSQCTTKSGWTNFLHSSKQSRDTALACCVIPESYGFTIIT